MKTVYILYQMSDKSGVAPFYGFYGCNVCIKLVSLEAERGKKKNSMNLWSHLKCGHLQASLRNSWSKLFVLFLKILSHK